jgi:hypothetical protein
MFKSMNFSFIALFFNLHNGFSALTIFGDLFYMLYDFNCTNLAVIIYLIFEQDIDMAFTNKEDKLGFKLSKYYLHCKEKVMERVFWEFPAWFVYSFAASIVMYFVP